MFRIERARTKCVAHLRRKLTIRSQVGVKLAILNAMLTSPALEFSLAWLYAASVVGGILMALYALQAASNPAGPEHDIMDVRE